MKLVKITNAVYEYYKQNVSGNENISFDMARRKLTRAAILGKKVEPKRKIEKLIGNEMVHYGNLHLVARRGKIIHIVNHKGGKKYGGWKFDEEKYFQLTIELGIS